MNSGTSLAARKATKVSIAACLNSADVVSSYFFGDHSYEVAVKDLWLDKYRGNYTHVSYRRCSLVIDHADAIEPMRDYIYMNKHLLNRFGFLVAVKVSANDRNLLILSQSRLREHPNLQGFSEEY
jgi:hypothetical protein